jgi:hypothetical protein
MKPWYTLGSKEGEKIFSSFVRNAKYLNQWVCNSCDIIAFLPKQETGICSECKKQMDIRNVNRE